jgi:STE24 endopeptidase
MAVLAPEVVNASGEGQATWALSSTQYLEILPMMLALMVYVFVVFGFLSRRCERQAAIHGCRAVSCDRADCIDHAFAERPTSHPLPLCPTGIRTFIQALERVALVNGISRDRPGFLQSWQHSSIARRVLFLEEMRLNPGIEPAFQRRLAHIKWGLFGLLAGLLLLLAGVLGGVVVP